MTDLTKRTWAEIDLSAIRNNYHRNRRSLPDGCRFLGVVKADAYGHGALRIAHLLQDEGADYLAVSCLDEALELRNDGVTMPILILGHTPYEYTDVLIRNSLTQTATCLAKAMEYSDEAKSLGSTLKIHIKLDTGMSRLGYLCDGSYFKDGVQNIIRTCRLPNLVCEGIYTHFSVADEPDPASRDYTLKQFHLFLDVLSAVEEQAGIRFPVRHCANSGAVVSYPETALDMVRPGLLLYGYGDPAHKLRLQPGMALKSRISAVKHYPAGTRISYGGTYTTQRETRMGVIPVGYADGLHRTLSNKARFWTKDGFAPQRGRICMDMCMIDLTELPGVGVGDEVEIFGPNADLEALAALAGTIPYELLCAVSPRVSRVYL